MNRGRYLLSEGQRLLVLLESLVWIAQIPQGPGRKGEADHPRVKSIEKGVGAVPLGVVEGKTLLKVFLRRNQLSKVEQVDGSHSVGWQEESRVLYALGQAEELLCQLMCRP